MTVVCPLCFSILISKQVKIECKYIAKKYLCTHKDLIKKLSCDERFQTLF